MDFLFEFITVIFPNKVIETELFLLLINLKYFSYKEKIILKTICVVGNLNKL